MYLECLDALDICVEDFNETKKSIKEACSTNLAKMDTVSFNEKRSERDVMLSSALYNPMEILNHSGKNAV